MKVRDYSVTLVEKLLNLINKHGVVKTKSFLDEALRRSTDKEEQRRTAIVEAVAACMNYQAKAITNGELWSRDEKRYWCITYVIVLYVETLKMKPGDIAPVFRMSEKNISHRISQFRALDEKNAIDNVRLTEYAKIVKQLKKHK